MEKNWVKIFSSVNLHEVLLYKAVLKNNDIEAVELNHMDSSYTGMGDIELYVKAQDAIRAKYLIEKNEGE